MTRGNYLDFTNETHLDDLPDFFTKDGDEIRFRFFFDINATNPSSRGLSIHSVVAFVGMEQVGYLNVAYIPRKRFEEIWPTTLHYVLGAKSWGTGVLPSLEQGDHRNLIREIAVRDPWLAGLEDDQDVPDDSTPDHVMREIYCMMMDRVEEESDRYMIASGDARRYEQPSVDFVNVHDDRFILPRPKLTLGSDGASAHSSLASRDWRGEGIGKALYVATGLWMQQIGYSLRSGASNADAQRVWQSLEKDGLVEWRESATTRVDEPSEKVPFLNIPENWSPSPRPTGISDIA